MPEIIIDIVDTIYYNDYHEIKIKQRKTTDPDNQGPEISPPNPQRVGRGRKYYSKPTLSVSACEGTRGEKGLRPLSVSLPADLYNAVREGRKKTVRTKRNARKDRYFHAKTPLEALIKCAGKSFLKKILRVERTETEWWIILSSKKAG